MRMILIIILVALSGCVTSSDHTKKGDGIVADALKVIEKYFKHDAENDPLKNEYARRLAEIRGDAEKHASEDPSLIGNASQISLGMASLLGGGFGAGSLLVYAFHFIKNTKVKKLVGELIETSDPEECRRKAREARYG